MITMLIKRLNKRGLINEIFHFKARDLEITLI